MKKYKGEEGMYELSFFFLLKNMETNNVQRRNFIATMDQRKKAGISELNQG